MTAGRTHVGDVWGRESDISHDSDHRLLLHIKFPRVEAPSVPKGGKIASWEDLLQEFTGWEGTGHDRPSAVARTGLEGAKRTATERR
jgi:hypothetical protein